MSWDYFISPFSPDFYCYQAIDSSSNVFPWWVTEIASFKDGGQDALPIGNPKMLEFIPQNYRIYIVGDAQEDADQKMMSKAYREWLERIKQIASDKLVPSLAGLDMILPEQPFVETVNYDTPYHFANVQNFNTLIPVSQKLSKPIFELAHWNAPTRAGRSPASRLTLKRPTWSILDWLRQFWR